VPIGFKATYNGRETEIDDLLIKREFFGDGGLFACGYNTSGAVGDGTTTQRTSFVSTAAGAGLNWKQVSGGSAVAAIKSDGTLWTWGYNGTGHLGDNTTTNRSSPGTTSGGGVNWKQVSMGSNQYYSFGQAAAVKTDGTLWTWGYNISGQLGTGDTTSRSSPGTTVGGGTNWKQVSCGYGLTSNMAAVKTDGTLWTWGAGTNGALGTGNTTSISSPGTTAGGGTNWLQVSCGRQYMAAVKTDGTLWSWGWGNSGRLGNDLSSDRSSPGTTSGGGTNWKQVSCGYNSTAAIKFDGTLWTWGSRANGQLGDGYTTTSKLSPEGISGGGTNWKQVSSRTNFMAAVKTDGTLWTWGRNTNGNLGVGNTTSTASPVTPVGFAGTSFKSVAEGTSDINRITLFAITELTI
jgi:alpha-tubulin suppressor-like RCC1 family protein